MLRGEIWWVEFEPAIGSEIKKTRPAVIVSNDAANRNLTRVIVIPLTSSIGNIYPGEAIIKINGKESKAMADQIMATDKTRLKNYVGKLLKKDMLLLEDAIKIQLALAR
jgi:mRNA interferase MazF